MYIFKSIYMTSRSDGETTVNSGMMGKFNKAIRRLM